MADPAPSVGLCSVDLMFLWEKKNRYLSLYYYLIDIENIKIMSLNFFSKTT